MKTRNCDQKIQQLHNISSFKLEKIIFVLITFVLIGFAGFREVGFDRDSLNYAATIQTVDLSTGFFNLNFSDKEPSFYVIVYITQWLFGDAVRGTFIIYAILGVTLKMLGIYRLSHVPLLSVIYYICSYYILHELTQIRVGVAAAIFLLALPDIINKNLWHYMLKICIATLFHYSAIILIFVYYINIYKKQYLFYLFLPLVGFILYFINFGKNILFFFNLALPQIIPLKLQLYLELLTQGIHSEINVANLFYISLIFIYYFFTINMSRLREPLDVLQVKLLGWMLFVFYSFASVPVLAFRLSELLGVVLIFILPLFAIIIKQKKIAYILILIYSFMMLFNYIYIQNMLKTSLLISKYLEIFKILYEGD